MSLGLFNSDYATLTVPQYIRYWHVFIASGYDHKLIPNVLDTHTSTAPEHGDFVIWLFISHITKAPCHGAVQIWKFGGATISDGSCIQVMVSIMRDREGTVFLHSVVDYMYTKLVI